MVRQLLVKERVVSGFNASRTVILTSKTGSGEREKVFEDAKLEALLEQETRDSKSRRIGTIIGSDSLSHFKTPQSHGNDSEARKLGAVRIEAERC